MAERPFKSRSTEVKPPLPRSLPAARRGRRIATNATPAADARREDAVVATKRKEKKRKATRPTRDDVPCGANRISPRRPPARSPPQGTRRMGKGGAGGRRFASGRCGIRRPPPRGRGRRRADGSNERAPARPSPSPPSGNGPPVRDRTREGAPPCALLLRTGGAGGGAPSRVRSPNGGTGPGGGGGGGRALFPPRYRGHGLPAISLTPAQHSPGRRSNRTFYGIS